MMMMMKIMIIIITVTLELVWRYRLQSETKVPIAFKIIRVCVFVNEMIEEMKIFLCCIMG